MRRTYAVLASSPVVDRCFTILLAVCAWVLLSIAGIAIAQTGPITPSGLNTQVNLSATPPAGHVQYDITGGTRPGGGVNLFHSFGNFNVPNNNIANFLNETALPTSNILGRVTGGNLSNIFGTIQTTGFGNANLFLMNPAGFLFGPNATVNVGGMVAFTSADYLRLGNLGGNNAGIFHADPAQTSVLTNAPVAAFGFLGSNPGAITVEGSQLILANGTGLSLVGGNVSIGADPATGTPAYISVPSGKIDLVSVASPGEILYPSLQTGPNINGQTFTAKGTVSISDFSFLDASGIAGQGNEAGGAVRIRGGQFVMDNLSAIQNMTMGDIAGENPGISIVVDHDVRLSNLSSISVGTGTGLGRSGNLDVSAENVEILSGSLLTSTSGGPAAPGDITITPTMSLTVSGLDPFVGTEPSNISTTAQSSVEGGNITIDFAGSSLSVQDNAAIGTSSDTGHAGNITLNSDILNVTNGGAVRTTSSNGSSGTIMITASDSAVISGQSALGNFSTIANNSQTTPANISITAGQFVLADQAEINGDTASQQGGTVNITATQSINISGNSTIRSSTAAGTGTSLELSAPTIAIDQSTLSTRISGSNPNNVGGTINATATNGNLTVSNNSLIAASTDGAADGGSIEVRASDSIIVTANSRIESTSTGTGNAGSVTFQGLASPAQSVLIDGAGSGIFTDTQGTGAGGNIFVNANSVTLQNGCTLSAITSGTGATATGGTITVDATNTVTMNGASITASSISLPTKPNSGAGNAGTITMTAEENIVLLGNSSIASAAESEGNGGLVSLAASSIEMHGNSNIVTSTTGLGNAGDIELQGNQVNLTESFVTAQTQAEGRGGNITIRGLTGEGSRATDVRLSDNSQLVSETIGTGEGVQGAAGNILVETARLNLSGGSLFNTASRGSTGAAGNITVNATDSLTISGFGTQLFSDSTEFSFGDAGNISIRAPSVVIENNGFISTSTSLVGNAGTITVNTNNLQLLSGGYITSSSLTESPEFPSGAAGSIDITATNGFTMQNSAITTQGGPGASGGNIKVTTSPEATVWLQNSTISASVADGPGGGGNISIDPQFVILQNSQILAQAAQGQGGAITITANLFLPDANSIVNADSGSGVNGTVTIQSPNAPASGKIQPLGKSPLQATSLLNQRCASLAGGEFSSLTVVGRDSLPTEPGGWLSSPLALGLAETGGSTLPEKGGRAGIDGDPSRETTVLSLRQIAPAGFLTQAFAVNWSAGCQS